MRNCLRPITDIMPFYLCIGNWESMGGYVDDNDALWVGLAEWARAALKIYFGNPSNLNSNERFWSLENGDCIVVSGDPETNTTADDANTDWKLGGPQTSTIATAFGASTRANKFFCIHKLVGGVTAYARGGPGAALTAGTAQAVAVGSVPSVHSMLKSNDVDAQFYGHDHIAAASRVDDMIYAEVGTATTKISANAADIVGYGTIAGEADLNMLNPGTAEPYCLVVVTVRQTGFTIEYWRTSTGVTNNSHDDDTTDHSDVIAPASTLLYSFNSEISGSGEGDTSGLRIRDLRPSSLRSGALRPAALV
jgi:hypothetical protein